MEIISSLKHCTKCHRELRTSEFYVKIKTTGRLFSWCKTCHNKIRSAAYRRDPDKGKRQVQRWRKNNPQRYRDTYTKWREDNREKVNRQSCQRNRANPERERAKRLRNKAQRDAYNAEYRKRKAAEIKAYNATYYQANREQVTARIKKCQAAKPELYNQLRKGVKHRRKVRLASNGPHEKFTDREIYERDKWICQLCGDPVDRELKFPNPMSASLDHVRPIAKGGGHTRANSQLAHLGCNSRKRDGRC